MIDLIYKERVVYTLSDVTILLETEYHNLKRNFVNYEYRFEKNVDYFTLNDEERKLFSKKYKQLKVRVNLNVLFTLSGLLLLCKRTDSDFAWEFIKNANANDTPKINRLKMDNPLVNEVTHKGVMVYFSDYEELCKKLSIDYNKFMNYIDINISLQDSLLLCTNKKAFLYKGKVYLSANELCEDYNICKKTYATLRLGGFTLEDIMSIKDKQTIHYKGKVYEDISSLGNGTRTSYGKILKRTRRMGMTPEEAMYDIRKKYIELTEPVELNGKVYHELETLSKDTSISIGALRLHLNKGLNINQIIDKYEATMSSKRRSILIKNQIDTPSDEDDIEINVIFKDKEYSSLIELSEAIPFNFYTLKRYFNKGLSFDEIQEKDWFKSVVSSQNTDEN